jgi:hypothetical protein
MKYVDLHIHTYFSDGTDSPLQVIRTAKMKGLDLIAIADHDNLRGYFRGIKEAQRWKINLVPAVEITTIEAHVLGLNFNPYNENFRKFVEYSKEVHDEVCSQRVEKLRSVGIPITFEKVRNAFPNSSLGKYSIIWTMLLDNECRSYLEKKHEDLSLPFLSKYYLSKEGIGGKVEKKRAIYWGETVREIKKAGGIVIFPHPSTSARLPSEIPNMMKSVDGLEVQPKFANENQPFADYAKLNNMHITYGSDYHSMYGGSGILGKGINQISDELAELLTSKN